MNISDTLTDLDLNPLTLKDYRPKCMPHLHLQIHISSSIPNPTGQMTRSESTSRAMLLQPFPLFLLLLPNQGLPYHSPSPCPWGVYSVGWMAPDRGLRGWNVSDTAVLRSP